MRSRRGNLGTHLDDNVGVAAVDITNRKVDSALYPNPEKSHHRLHQGWGAGKGPAASARRWRTPHFIDDSEMRSIQFLCVLLSSNVLPAKMSIATHRGERKELDGDFVEPDSISSFPLTPT